MADLSDIQAAQAVKVVGATSAGVEQTPVQSTANGGLHINRRDSAGTELGTTANPDVVAGAGVAGTPAGGVVSVQGVASGTAVPVSAAALPLPTGASTATNQTSANTKLDTLHADFGVVEGKQDTGNTSLSSIDSKLTKLRAKNYLDSTPIEILADDQGRIFVSPSTVGTPLKLRISRNIAVGATIYSDYTVGASLQYQLSSFYAGGTGTGQAMLIRHYPNNFLSISEFETSGDVANWGVLQGTFVAPTPDVSTTQHFAGTSSMRWSFTDASSAAKALKRRNTFANPADYSTHRYIRVRFYNDATVGITRTLSVVLNSGVSARTFTFALTSGVTLPNNAWTTLTCDLENPTTTTGTTFDITSINSIDLSVQDSAVRVSTVYWDALRLEDEFDRLHRIYFGNLITVPLTISETIAAGDSVYLAVANTGAAAAAFTSVVSGVLV